MLLKTRYFFPNKKMGSQNRKPKPKFIASKSCCIPLSIPNSQDTKHIRLFRLFIHFGKENKAPAVNKVPTPPYKHSYVWKQGI